MIRKKPGIMHAVWNDADDSDEHHQVNDRFPKPVVRENEQPSAKGTTGKQQEKSKNINKQHKLENRQQPYRASTPRNNLGDKQPSNVKVLPPNKSENSNRNVKHSKFENHRRPSSNASVQQYNNASCKQNRQRESRDQSKGKRNRTEENGPTHDKERTSRPMGYLRLMELISKPPNEILLTLKDTSSGLNRILEQEDCKRDSMALFLIALGKAVSSSLSNNMKSILTTISSKNQFFLIQIPQYLATFLQKCKNERYHLDSINSFCDFLLEFQKTLPNSASEILIILLPLLEKISTSAFPIDDEMHSVVLTKIKKLDEDNQHFLIDYTPKEIKQKSEKEKLHCQEPPENFRTIPVLPSSDDIHMPCSFLRPNLVKGQYIDTEHYLDVQYRLLREDYIRPLRDGVSDFLSQLKKNKQVKSLKDARVYTGVQIIKQDFVRGGLVHIALFDVNKFSKIKWEFSKRFLSGSLLCLSDNNFETMLFASVAVREPKELSNGKLVLRFEELTDEVLNMSPLRSFVVIETTAYFEAYRHNLSALQGLNEEHLSMKSYIVNVQKDVGKPKYLQDKDTYDMRPLLIPLSDDCIRHHSDVHGKVITSYEFPANLSSRAASIPVLKEESWPTFNEMNLDPSQYNAIKAAVTKEFTVIQGPPGTGKTYVGLRIAQLLLHNWSKWQPEGGTSPILVVCYTNHALDQFLEGLLMFTRNIVRVGGRGSNESLAQYQLNNLKRVIEDKRQVPNHIFRNIKQKNFELRKLKENIDEIKGLVDKSYSSVLDEYQLHNHIESKHKTSLLRMKKFLPGDDYLMFYWLNVKVGMKTDIDDSDTVVSNDATQQVVDMFDNFSISNDDGNTGAIEVEDVDSEGEADIEYIEAQRALNPDEFADVSFDVPELQNEIEMVVEEGDDNGWEVQGGRKKRKRFIRQCLNYSKAMAEPEANSITDVWELNLYNRWRLYKFWVEKFVKEKIDSIFEKQQELRKEFEELVEMRSEEDLYVCRQAQVVGMTTTGAAKYRSLLTDLNPKIVIVEEAAEILECHIVTSLTPGTEHVILIGDHQQLRPSPTVHTLAVKFDLNVSLFERMLNNGMECYRLGIQHRMRPEIAALLVPHIYKDLRNHESVTEFENVKGISKNVFFVSHDISEQQEFDSKSKVNQHEAKFIISLCRYILLQGYEPSQITVLTTYSGQLFAFKNLKGKGLLQGIRFTVVDNYQGEENDIILISFVRSNVEGQIGFLKISNRVCVALSRAKKGLFCIGNFELLAEKSDLWKNIVTTLNLNKAIGPSLQLMCQNHPGVSNCVSCDKDFESVPEGGCTRNCEYRLSCGHVCSLVCHPYDMEHINIRCQKQCSKLCEYGHTCKRKCFQKCGSCMELVDQKIPSCGHTIKIPCNKQGTVQVCTKPCEKLLPCGHTCSNTCDAPCVLICRTKVLVGSKCGHKVNIECCDSMDEEKLNSKCRSPCTAELSCGHMCRGDCRSCKQGRLHVACNQPCKRVLVCGHECKSPCSKSCPPCKRKCENRCVHSVCPKSCGEPCDVCIEPCKWSCEHKKCLRKCGELCNRTSCRYPCKETLKCNHPCIGFCGEPCPDLCRICDQERVQEIFFGSEDEPNARFVCLEDCGHCFEVEGITHWMEAESKEKHQIQMKRCPLCKTVIRKNLRFGNIVKSCLKEIEKVKKVTFGDKESNFALQKSLVHKVSGNLKYFLTPILNVLISSRCRSKQEITTIENMLNIANLVQESTNFCDDTRIRKSPLKEHVSKLNLFMKITQNWINAFVLDEFLTASDQQLQEIAWEVHRLKLANKLLGVLLERTALPEQHAAALMSAILSHLPFREADLAKCTDLFQKLYRLLGEAVINVSDLEKQNILKAMGLSAGHWYQCPNGHVYCITECGGATQVGSCNECGSAIGGTGHTLISSNRVATAMDGARHSAWSDEMNMMNYEL